MATSSTGVSMRPNLADSDSQSYNASPDIWLSGTTALNVSTMDPTKASDTKLYAGETNLIYVRGKNASDSTRTVTVQLYQAVSNTLNAPSRWQPLQNDLGQTQALIQNVAPGAYMTCPSPFVWVRPDTISSSNYSLFARFNDTSNSCPFPAVDTILDPQALIRGNSSWGCRQVSSVTAASGNLRWSYTQPLLIASSTSPYRDQFYVITVNARGFGTGWSVSFYSSRLDSAGNAIVLPKTTIQPNSAPYCMSMLAPGFSCLMTVNLYNTSTSATPPAGASLALLVNPRA